ncbi:MAG TPA: potassium transporter TrkG [Burkholderiaceae bacterium]|nr:potassium transporter TrkG [Burkholderiaceae bacterium]
MQRVYAIAHVLGGLLMVMAATYLLPIAWSLATGDGTADSFIEAGLATVTVGLLLWAPTRHHRRELQARDGCLLVVLTWVSMAAAASVPFLLELPGMSFTDAYFESMSALTTTGATVLADVEALPPGLALWRHALQWFGGMGIIVLAIAILPLLGVGGMQLFKAEMPGPMKETKLTPRITQTAKYLWLIYVTLTGLCALGLRAAGMDWFDAVCHAFSALALGGFSTRNEGIAAFDSPAIEAVLMVFMLLAVINFTTHFTALRARSTQAYGRDPEAPWVWGSIVVAALGMSAYLWWTGTYEDPLAALRFGAFKTVSMATATGYAGADYEQWPGFAAMSLLLLSTLCSSSGSTGGGIKMVRTLILFKQAGRELLRMSHPHAVRPLLMGRQIVGNHVVFAVLGFMLLYGATLVAVTLLLIATGLDFETAFAGTLACLNNVGPALGELGPTDNYAGLNAFQTWVFAVTMLAGRLELLTFFALLTPAFWRR